MGQANSTFVLNPDGLSSITFDTLDLASSQTGYYVHPSTIKFNEDKREELFYSGGKGVDGGSFVSSFGPLVPVEFIAIVYGTTRAQMITRAQALKKAVTNLNGGTLQYQPQDVTVRDTYYHYVKSKVPKLAKMEENLWDGNSKVNQTLGEIYMMAFDVTLQTQPAATSNPDSLTSLTLSRTTLHNTTYSTYYNYFDIDGDEIVGDLPANIYLRIRNSQTNDQEKIARIILTARDQGLSILNNLVQIYEAEDAEIRQQDVHWSTVVDPNRSGGNYLRCNLPEDSNLYEQILRFTISNEIDHRGRIGILACVQTAPGNQTNWSTKIRYNSNNNQLHEVDTGAFLDIWDSWHLAYCGDIDMPSTIVTNEETVDASIDLVFIRSEGSLNDYLNIDFIALVFLDQTAIQFDIHNGFDNGERLLSFGDEKGNNIAHIVDQSTSVLHRVVDRHYGNGCLTANAGLDERVFILCERVYNARILIYDDFDSYKGQYWLQIATFESNESWVYTGTGGIESTNQIEGVASRSLPGDAAPGNNIYLDLDETLDLENDGRFTDDDYVMLCINKGTMANGSTVSIRFVDVAGDYFYVNYLGSDLSNLWNYMNIEKSSFNQSGAPDWSQISQVRINLADLGGADIIYLDNWYLAKADPDTATEANPTGSNWNFESWQNYWTLTEDTPDDTIALACNWSSIYLRTAVRNDTIPNNVRGFVKLCCMDTGGDAFSGVAFRVVDYTLNSEDLYAFVIDWDHDELELYEYTAGVQTSLATAISQSVSLDTWYWLGFVIKDDLFYLYFSSTEPSGQTNVEKLTNLCILDNRIFVVTDSTKSSGYVGVVSYNGLCRFGELYVEDAGNRHVPSDQVTVESAALFRTIYPFPD